MKLPLSWLEEFVLPLTKTEKLAKLLTLSGTEVSAIEHRTFHFSGVIVGEILTIIKHPAADRLSVTKVVVKDGRKQPLTIVCGATNIKPRQKVPVAPPGAKLANGKVIEMTTIRGVVSEGMLCSPDELGLDDDHSGILLLSPDIPLGMPLEKALALNETILHFDLTPNRSDCFAVLGLAREISVLTKRPLKPPKVSLKEGKTRTDKIVKVTIRDRAVCTRYVARYLKGVTIGPSPQWMRNQLEASGIRPINNVVDVTNSVMLELGQPLHAFDGRQVLRKSIIVRRARRGERLKLLDGTTVTLNPEIPVIADPAKALVVAGIVGGEGSGVTEKTRDVIIESATFNPVLIRKASQALGIRTEASHRHEKGPDPAVVRLAADRAAQLIAELTGGEVAKGTAEAGSAPPFRKPIRFRLADAEALLGVDVTEQKARELLTRLGCEIKSGKGGEGQAGEWQVTPPSWRSDLQIPEDLTEEVGRLIDYNTFPLSQPSALVKPTGWPPGWLLERQLKRFFVSVGFSEVLTYPYYSQHQRTAFGLSGQHLELLNPLSPDQQYLRQSLTPRLVDVVVKNRPAFEEVRVFEIGSVFLPSGGRRTTDERWLLGAALLGADAFRILRGVLEDLLALAGVQATTAVEGNRVTFRLSGTRLATLTAYGPEAVRAFKLRSAHPLATLELSLAPLLKSWQAEQHFVPYSSFPAVKRDLAFWLPRKQAYGPIHEALRRLDPSIQDIELFDVYEKDNRRSYAIHLTFQADDRTLKAEEVALVIQRACELLRAHYQAEIRS